MNTEMSRDKILNIASLDTRLAKRMLEMLEERDSKIPETDIEAKARVAKLRNELLAMI